MMSTRTCLYTHINDTPNSTPEHSPGEESAANLSDLERATALPDIRPPFAQAFVGRINRGSGSRAKVATLMGDESDMWEVERDIESCGGDRWVLVREHH